MSLWCFVMYMKCWKLQTIKDEIDRLIRGLSEMTGASLRVELGFEFGCQVVTLTQSCLNEGSIAH